MTQSAQSETPDYSKPVGSGAMTPDTPSDDQTLDEQAKRNRQRLVDLNEQALDHDKQSASGKDAGKTTLGAQLLQRQRQKQVNATTGELEAMRPMIGERHLPDAGSQVQDAVQSIDRATDNIAAAEQQVSDARTSRAPAPSEDDQSAKPAGRHFAKAAGAAFAANQFRQRQQRQRRNQQQRSGRLTQDQLLASQKDQHRSFINQAEALTKSEKTATGGDLAKVHKQMRLLAARELFPGAKSFSKPQLQQLNADPHKVLDAAKNVAQTRLNEIDQQRVTPKQPLPDNVVPLHSSDTGLSQPHLETATITNGMKPKAAVEKTASDKSFEPDKAMDAHAQQTSESVNERIDKLQQHVAELEAQNAQLQEQLANQSQDSSDKHQSLADKWRQNRETYKDQSTKSLLAETATRFGKGALKVSGRVAIGALGMVAAAGVYGAKKATQMSHSITQMMDGAVLNGVEPKVKNDVGFDR